MIPRGDYTFRISDAHLITSSTKTPGISFIATIVNGPHAGSQIIHNMYRPKRLDRQEYWNRQLAGLGIPATIPYSRLLSVLPAGFVGRVTHDMYNDRDYERVLPLASVEEFAEEPADVLADALSDLAAALEKVAVALRGNPPTA